MLNQAPEATGDRRGRDSIEVADASRMTRQDMQNIIRQGEVDHRFDETTQKLRELMEKEFPPVSNGS